MLLKDEVNVSEHVLMYLLGKFFTSDDEEVVKVGIEKLKLTLAENYVRPDEAARGKSLIREKNSIFRF